MPSPCIPDAPPLTELVLARQPRHPAITAYVYLSDWQGDGDIRCAVIYDNYALNESHGYAVVWDHAHDQKPFGSVTFQTISGCGRWVESLAAEWAETVLPEVDAA